MDLTKILVPGAVRVVGQLTSKKRVFQELGDMVAQAWRLDAATAVDGLQERESLGPTGVGHGVALPHARLDDLPHIIGVFLRLEKPIDYDSVDRQPVDLIFGLFAPKDSGVEHLKANPDAGSFTLKSRIFGKDHVTSKFSKGTNAEDAGNIQTDMQLYHTGSNMGQRNLIIKHSNAAAREALKFD